MDKAMVLEVGRPLPALLREFGDRIFDEFKAPCYLVGSSLRGNAWHDVDVRLILKDETYKALGLGEPAERRMNPGWLSLCVTYSALGKAMTGLPVDFQIQQRTFADTNFHGMRRVIGSRF